MNLNEEILSYLDGELSDEQKARFEGELKNDPGLKMELRLQKLIIRAAKEENKQKLSAVFNEEYHQFHKVRKQRRLIYYLSAAIILLLFSYLFVFRSVSYSTDELFLAYYHPYTPEVNTRNNNDQNIPIILAIKEFNKKNYAGSLKHIADIENQNQQIVNFMYGQIYLAQGNCSLSTNYFNKSLLDQKTTIDVHVKWYLALSCLKCLDMNKCKGLLTELVKTNSQYRISAKKLINELPE